MLRVRENQGPRTRRSSLSRTARRSQVDDNTFAVTDQDGNDTTLRTRETGDDEEVLAFDSSGKILGFKADHEPDYEEKSSYSITITASSGSSSRRRSTTLDVTIEVVDTEDPGEVFLSQRQPQVGIDGKSPRSATPTAA